MTAVPLADPALVVLAGAAGSGKSAWAATRFRAAEIVSSDALRGIVGSGPADLDASVEAFDLLDQIVAARTRRGLTTVIDTLGLDPNRRNDYLRLARSADLPAVLVIMDTPARALPPAQPGAGSAGAGSGDHRATAPGQEPDHDRRRRGLGPGGDHRRTGGPARRDRPAAGSRS